MLSPPQTMPALLLAYSKIKEKKIRILRKEDNVRTFQNCTMMATALSTQNKELTSKNLPVTKRKQK